MSDSDFETHLKIITSAGERTRGSMYFLGLVFVALLAYFVNTDIFPWIETRNVNISKAQLCYIEHTPDGHNVPGTDPKMSDPCSKYYEWVKAYFIYENNTGDQATISPLTEQALSERYKDMVKDYIDQYSVTLPIISIQIDVNNVIFFATIAIIMLLFLVRASMNAEYKCTEHVKELELLTTKSRIAAITSSHVFNGPDHSILFWWFLYAPFAMIAYDVGRNLVNYNLFTAKWDDIMLFNTAQAICLGFLLYQTIKCHIVAARLDQQLKDLQNGTQSLPLTLEAPAV
jgi:hypothetical protein